MTQKVVVAMSGGVDSSVTAALLKEQGYDVYGITMRLLDREKTEGPAPEGGCCGTNDFFDARSVAQTLGIPHYFVDFTDPFRRSVIDYFKASYLRGQTPNPCIACNQHIKFRALLEQALALGAEFLATGHYARIERHDGSPTTTSGMTAGGGQNRHPPRSLAGDPLFVLKKAVDASKDQSYVLYHLTQKELPHLLFPLGDYTKVQIRELARRYGLRTADKPDSQEICFIPDQDYRKFIAEEVPEKPWSGGPIRHVDGRVLGQHKGLPFYTVGQREKLGVAVGKPLYVTAIDTAANTLVVGDKEDTLSRGVVVRELSWVSGAPPESGRRASVKIRYKHAAAPATLKPADPLLTVTFDSPQSAVTPGQAAVFYNGEEVLGGGTIDNAF